MDELQKNANEENALDGSSSTSDAKSTELSQASGDIKTAAVEALDQPSLIKRILLKVNIYLLFFVFLVVVAGAAIAVFYLNAAKQPDGPKIDSQTLDQEAINQLANTDAKVGDAKSVLTVQSNAVFAGQVVIGGDVSVAGGIKVGKPLTVNDLNVSGASILSNIQAQSLTLANDATIQGKLNVRGEANFAGNTNFGGTINASQIIVNKLSLAGNGSFELNNHLSVTGPSPGLARGNALGGGGTASISGSDTAGSITINTGNSPAPGCFVNITFARGFNSTPAIVLTPIGASAAGVNVYATRTTSGFSICTTNSAPGGQSFGYDYIAIE